MSGIAIVEAGQLMMARGGSVNPALHPNEDFDLYSIPAFDAGAPEIVKGSAIGSTKQVVRPNDVLLSKIVPHIRRAWIVGAEHGRRQIGSSEWIVFRSDLVHPPYLRHVLVGDRFHDYFMQTVSGVGGSLLRARPAFVAAIPIPLPPLPEQRRIAAILDTAEALRTKRRAAIAQLDKLKQAIFIDMFGDPVTNPKGWSEEFSLGEVAEIVSGVTKGRKLGGKTTRELPYLAVANVQDKFLKLDSIKSIEATDREISRYLIKKGDLLLTEGGDPDKLGRGTLWNDELPECIHQNHVFRVRLTASQLTPLFLNWLVGSQRGKDYFLRSAKQTTGIASINMTQLRGFPLLVPPLALQQAFANVIQQIDHLKSKHRAALALDDALFASLQHRAFNGELIAKALAHPQQRSFAELGHFDALKGLEALVYAAKRLPKKGHYWPLKAQYIADRRHLERHGRTIYGETHVAMPYGPVPQAAYNASRALANDELICEFPMDAVRAALRREKDSLVALRDAAPDMLSAEERESLDWAIKLVADMSFDELKTQTHDAAWEKTPRNAPMRWKDIIESLAPAARQRLLEQFE